MAQVLSEKKILAASVAAAAAMLSRKKLETGLQAGKSPWVEGRQSCIFYIRYRKVSL